MKWYSLSLGIFAFGLFMGCFPIFWLVADALGWGLFVRYLRIP